MTETVFSKIAENVGEAIALERDGQSWSYRQLWDAAGQCADHLHANGVEAGNTVALLLPRGLELAAGVLGSWLVGAAYLPLDPAATEARQEQILSDAQPRCLVDEQAWQLLIQQPIVSRQQSTPKGSDLAYVIYTSGSTGRPKGVEVPHSALANLIDFLVNELAADSSTSMLWLTQFSFDMSVPELFVPLSCGGMSVVAPDQTRSDGRLLAETIASLSPDIVQATPSTWRLALDEMEDHLEGRVVMIGGEPTTPEVVTNLLDRGASVLHCYGPTETTVWSTMGWISQPPSHPVPVGMPIAATEVACMGEDRAVLPDGEQGEVWIAGAGLALGYRGAEELTAERFVEHPELGRVYRTGDIGRWNSDGHLELLGRADRQIKLRGNRIELGDVEAAMSGHPDVKAVAVECLGPPESRWLGALVVADQIGPAELLAHCRASLPQAMVPSMFHMADHLPLNVNRKVDHTAVSEVLLNAPAPDSPSVVDTDSATEELSKLWLTHLPIEHVAAETNFFLAGGHSLLAAICLREVEERWGVSLSLDDFFSHPTLAELAALIQTVSGRPPAAGRVERSRRSKSADRESLNRIA